ncbi:uncharacterized protein Z518_11140 [Rhinocladiella mackenziei CBS 650.93]|uniref:15.0 kDa protein in dhaT-dhaS intergenic region n=1 Tax=Rhinocladiella mackenziei CBS 650.93 TaxID=1442369 RepID=A0A0D2GMY5_9EURO|nr:uncharacterized protein Z518_11140 [Rhinocladiella mackenziei CBS 650.93]KIW99727.1 hypothetical protein Z518_11140 [Rhinocladiella mackenziei CBS 650.93]
MHFLNTLLILPALALGQNTATNFLGSTPSQRHFIDQAQATKVISVAAGKAVNISVPENIAVVDPSGALVAFLKMDNAFPASADIATKKAKTVAGFNGAYTTDGLYNSTQPGAPLYGLEETNGGLVVFGGGLPIFVDGFFIGAIGVSGGTNDQDVTVAMAGVHAIGVSS